VGYQSKDFDNSDRDDFSGATADLGVVWQPLIHASLTAHVNYAAEDTDTVGDYIETLGGSLGWEHSWHADLSSSVQYLYTNEQYVGVTREDDTHNLLLSVNYEFSRWMKLTAGYEFTNKDSNASDISYDKNAVNLGLVVAL